MKLLIEVCIREKPWEKDFCFSRGTALGSPLPQPTGGSRVNPSLFPTEAYLCAWMKKKRWRKDKLSLGEGKVGFTNRLKAWQSRRLLKKSFDIKS